RVEAPGRLAGFCVVRTDVSAHAELGAGVADEHLPSGDSRSARDRVTRGLVVGQCGPDFVAGLRINGNEPAIQRADVDLSVVGSDAASGESAAHIHSPLARHFGPVSPKELAGARIESLDVAPRGRDIQHAVYVERS